MGLGLLALLLMLAGMVAYIWVCVEAFKEEWWKGALAFFVFFYWLYYAFVEFEHEYKWPLVLVGLFGHIGGYLLLAASKASGG